MDPDSLYERWRHNRSQIDPPEGFVDGVMESIGSPALKPEAPAGSSRISAAVRASVCAAAVLAALFRVVELVNLFAASQIEN